jgi:hypothetical protein
MLPTKFWFIWPSGFRGEDLKRSANQKQELPKAAIFVNGWDKMSNLERGPSIDVFYQISLHLAEGFQRRRLKCEKLTLSYRNKKRKFCRGPSNKHSCTVWL